jgi:hypothetical protein
MKTIRQNMHRKSPGLVFLTLLLISLAVNAWAVGPVDVGSVPGGATVTDSDGGSGEQWGRAGGRTIQYENFLVGDFTLLRWQPLAVGMAFDNEITGGTDEEMSGPLQPFPDTLRWTGETTITDASAGNAIVPVYTRFTVTASEIFTGLPDSIDIIAAGGNFWINVLFEASLNPAGPWMPALDFFDVYPTPGAHDGYAQTSFNSGFFFEIVDGMTLEEHDSNMQGRFNDVDGALEFLTLEFAGWVPGISATVGANNDLLNQIMSQLAQLLGAGPGNWATIGEIEQLINGLMGYIGDEVSSLRDRMSMSDNLMICMWVGNAFGTCPPQVPFDIPTIAGLSSAIESLASGVSGCQAIEVTAMKSNNASTSDGTIMVLTSLNGQPTDAEITEVTAVTESKKNGIGAETLSFSTSPVTNGLQGLMTGLPGNLSSIRTLMITVEYTDPLGNTLYGSTMISDWN